MSSPTIAFAKRPEVTVSTMGKVHNPSGSGVAATSSVVKAKLHQQHQNGTIAPPSSPALVVHPAANGKHVDSLDTRVKEEGSSRRNIVRKKSADVRFDKNKKQGGAGKNKWALDDGSDAVYATPTDVNDPLYDEFEDNDKNFILTTAQEAEAKAKNYDENVGCVVYGPMLTLPEFKRRVDDLLREYYSSSESAEVAATIREMACDEYHHEVLKRALGLALDHGPREREMTSKLLAALTPSLLTPGDVRKGFEGVVAKLDDLETDVPDATAAVGAFMARAVVDEVLPPAFLAGKEGKVTDHAKRLLSREHCSVRLEKVWGPGDGRSVPELKEAMDLLLKEYLLSRELDEAACCVQEINEPLFHHELVKRGIKVAAESGDADDILAMGALFEFLVKNSIGSEQQLLKGFDRAHTMMEDLRLDVPDAEHILAKFVALAKEAKILPADYKNAN